MNRPLLITLAAGVAIVPVMFGVAASASAFEPTSPSSVSSSVGDSATPTPTASSSTSDLGRVGDDADDSATPTPTASSTTSDPGRVRNEADDPVTTASATSATPTASASSSDDPQRQGCDNGTASSADGRHGRGSVDPTTSPTVTTAQTGDHKGHGTKASDGSRGHGGKN